MKEIYVKIGIVFLIVLIFLSMNYHQSKTTVVEQKKPDKADKPVQVALSVDNKISYLNLDDYLLGVVAGEMPAEFAKEALKAQVVASRTFVFNRDLSVDNTTNSQVYLNDEQMRHNWGDKYDEFRQKIESAIKETNNEVMKYQGKYISALFFSSSNGYTENVEDYFESSALPYLRSVDCHWDLQIDPTNTRTATFTKAELKEKFNCDDLEFNIIAYKKSGRIATLAVGKQHYTGRKVREILGLASSCFMIKYEAGKYVFTTIGSGHGVGMSQYGAQGMALEGSNYHEILNHFYQGVEIVNN